MKKFLPFLWLLPVVWFFVGMIFILLSGTGGTSGGFIAIILAAAYGVQLFVPVAYFCKRDSFKKYMLLLILISAIPTVAAIAVNGEEAGAACVLTLICAVACMFSLNRQLQKQEKETPAVPSKPVEVPAPVAPAKPQAPVADVPLEELKQLKELLDMGAITQEEYDMKKKQLLGL